MNTKLLAFCFSLMWFLVSSCQLDFFKDAVADDPKYEDVQSELWPYFERFEAEAYKRGLHIDLSEADLKGVIQDITTAHVLGQCSYNSQYPNKVTIDKPFWDKASDLGKEFVVFHELGHCYLGRGHDESNDARGICLSIMRSGTGSCRDNYTTQTRFALLNELFSGKKQ